jgi:hypothetical protein
MTFDTEGQEYDSNVKEHTVYKYSQNIPLADEIVLDNKNVFLQIIDSKPVISRHIDLSMEKNIILYPHDDGLVSPIIPRIFCLVEWYYYSSYQTKGGNI